MSDDLRKRLGDEGEQQACDFLVGKGFHCRERNFRKRFGEIDLVMEDRNFLVFVEVKLRRTIDYGAPEEALTAAKIRRITKTAVTYIMEHRLKNRMVRFDVVAIDAEGINHVPDAFEAIGNYYY